MLTVLQAGRAFAAVGVAAFHLSILMGLPRYGGDAVFREVTKHWDLGVDFFFVLSGFIILHAHHRDIGVPERWKDYVYKRLVRIFPIYWIYTASFLVMLAIMGGTDAKMPVTVADWAATISLVRFSNLVPPLSVAWTLFHEVAFYAVFSLLILNRRLGIAACAVFFLVCLARFKFATDPNASAFEIYTSVIHIEFFFGMAAYALFRRGGSALPEFVLGLVVFMAAVMVTRQSETMPQLLFAIAFAFVLAAMTKHEAAGRVRSPDLLTLVGDASYSIYLLHLPIQGVLLKVFFKLNLPGFLGSVGTYLLGLLLTVVIGVLAYLFVEKPLLGLLRRPSNRPRPESAVLAKT